MQITVNGIQKEVAANLTLQALLEQLGVESGTVVVERNREIYSAADFAAVEVLAGDVLEIVRFMGGG